MSWVSNWLNGGSNPADSANDYLKQIPGQTAQYYDPYIYAGQRAMPGMEEQYNQLREHPGQRMNEIGQDFHQSPGFQFALQQALGGAGHAAAAGGMAGSPQHEQQNMQLATDLGNQDYYKWLQGALGMYGQGLQGGENQLNRGFQASGSMADMIAQTLAQQGQLAYSGQASQNQGRAGAISDIMGLGGKILGAAAGGMGGMGAGGMGMNTLPAQGGMFF